MRFNKGYSFPIEYPLAVELDGLNGRSRLVNPVIGKRHGLAAPTMPGDDGFDDELVEVVQVREQVQSGVWPADFLARHHPEPRRFEPSYIPAPLYAQGITIEDPMMAARVVHMDKPWHMPEAIYDWLLDVGTPLKSQSGHVDFIGTIADPWEDIADSIKWNLRKAFEAKYYFGRPRPEEVLSLPGAVLTAYPEGCPCHPAYPAGHGAAAAAVKQFGKHFDLTSLEEEMIFDTAYHWAMYRTFAGVHYANDNLAGLRIGGLR